MSTVGYLLEDDREERRPYCPFVERPLEGDGVDKGANTIEWRLRDLWACVDALGKVRGDGGAFELRLGEPEHYQEIGEGM